MALTHYLSMLFATLAFPCLPLPPSFFPILPRSTLVFSRYRPKELDVDYGEPLETCHPAKGEEAGVYVREYTKSSIRVDCNKWEATITPKAVGA